MPIQKANGHVKAIKMAVDPLRRTSHPSCGSVTLRPLITQGLLFSEVLYC